MKLKAEIISVTTNGETMMVRCQGKTNGEAEWRRWGNYEIELPDIIKNRKSLYLGRILEISIVPK